MIGEAATGGVAAAPAAGGKKPPKRERKSGGGASSSSEALPSPLQGTVFKVVVEQGAEVAEGDLVCVIEAMKMENEITAHRAGKVTALVCHATCLLLETRLPNGSLLVEGKTWTGFANDEERYADGIVGRRIQPFWIEDEARQIPGTNFVVDQPFREFAVRDGRLVTGQQQNSGAAAARLVVEALGR